MKGKRIKEVSLIDQKSEPCLLKPKKLALDKQGVKLLAANMNNKAQSAQKEPEANSLDKANEDNSGVLQQAQNNGGQTSNSKRRLTFIKTKNINFHSLSKISSRLNPSATSTHQAQPGLKIRLQKTNGESTDRSLPGNGQMRFAAAQATCQSALATHKNTGKDLSQARTTHLSMQSSNT